MPSTQGDQVRRRSLRCGLGFHTWSYRLNEEGETYYVCTRCHRESPRDYPWFGWTFGAAKR